MNTPSRPTRRLAAIAAGTLLIAACGGSDGADTTDDPAPADDSVSVSEDAISSDTDGSEVLADSEPRDAILEGVDPDGELEDAIGALSPETRFDIVAGQLEPQPNVEVDGTNIRLVFDGGSVANAFSDCIIAGVTALETETVTVVYPDGEEIC